MHLTGSLSVLFVQTLVEFISLFFSQMKSFMISFWNIQGLYSSTFDLKTTDPDFLNSIKDIDILILLETWCRCDAVTRCPSGCSGITEPSFKLSTVWRGRDSGGMMTWIKADLTKNITTIKSKNHIWLKMNKHRRIYICV